MEYYLCYLLSDGSPVAENYSKKTEIELINNNYNPIKLNYIESCNYLERNKIIENLKLKQEKKFGGLGQQIQFNMTKSIGDTIKVPGMGFMGLEEYIGTIVGTNQINYIIDFGEDTVVEQRFQTRSKKLFE